MDPIQSLYRVTEEKFSVFFLQAPFAGKHTHRAKFLFNIFVLAIAVILIYLSLLKALDK